MSNALSDYLGPYRLLNVVHTGRVYQIWQARDDAYNRLVGIKTVREPFRADRQQLRYLRTEYRVGREVIHPAVIRVHAFDPKSDSPYLVMEWFPAPNMKRRIQQGVDKMGSLLSRVIEQAAEALTYVHWRGWIHRDVKPDNFLVADDGSVKLIDFALAVHRRRGIAACLTKWCTRQPKVQGTRSYMSPEQIRGETVDERADLYSFACTVYELLSGRPPFLGADSDDLLNQHLRAQAPSLESLCPLITPELSQLVRRSMAKDPNSRPKTVGDFLREFRMIRLFKAAKPANL